MYCWYISRLELDVYPLHVRLNNGLDIQDQELSYYCLVSKSTVISDSGIPHDKSDKILSPDLFHSAYHHTYRLQFMCVCKIGTHFAFHVRHNKFDMETITAHTKQPILDASYTQDFQWNFTFTFIFYTFSNLSVVDSVGWQNIYRPVSIMRGHQWFKSSSSWLSLHPYEGKLSNNSRMVVCSAGFLPTIMLAALVDVKYQSNEEVAER